MCHIPSMVLVNQQHACMHSWSVGLFGIYARVRGSEAYTVFVMGAMGMASRGI